ncbi:MAG: PAS domain-containing protein [Ignavibacteriales bacterium]|nr:PAS domain-containing protein [Ignavibacteriales bacterium]
MTSYSVSPALLFNDSNSAVDALESARQNKDLVYIAIVDDSNKVFASFNIKNITPDTLNPEEQARHFLPDEEIYETITPIYHNGRFIGRLFLGISLEKLNHEINQSRLTSALVSLGIFIVGLIGVFSISTIVTKPLHHMAKTAEDIAQGDLTKRTVVSSYDEVGRLATSFNTMVENLHLTQRELENINRTLEKRVQDRTKELQDEITERKKTDNELHKSIQRQTILLRSLPMAFYTADVSPSINTTWISEQVEQLTGYKPEQFIKDRTFWASHIHPEDKNNTLQDYKRVLFESTSITEYRWQCSDSAYHWFLDHTVLIRDASGNPKEIIGTWLDISDRKKSEAEIVNWKHRYELVVASSGQIVYDYDIKTGAILWSGSIKQVLGYDTNEFSGGIDQWSELIHPDDRAEALRLLEIAENNISQYEFRYRFRHKDGKYIWVLDRGFFISDVQKKAVRMLGMMQDISKEKLAEEELRKLSSAVEQSPVSIIITNTSGEIEYVNSKFLKVTGYNFQEVLNQNPRILKSGETSDSEYKKLWDTISSGKEWRGEFHNKKKNGELFWESATISPIIDNEGKITHYLAVKEDITEKKILESQFYRAQRIESLGTLAGGVAHDLNNVLAPILMAVQLLKSNASDEKKQQWLSMMRSSTERGVSIVKQLLTFARGAEGERILVQPKHLLREIEKIVSETFPRNIQIRTEIPKSLWTISADTTQLHQVIINLCVNARDAMPTGGNLMIRAMNIILDERTAHQYLEGKPGPYVVITVEDTGMGVPKNIIDKIFDPFFTTKDVGKGTGLGLSTVMSIIKSHGGFINVYSEVGHGSVFKIYLPASEIINIHEAEEDRLNLPLGNGESILIIDDEAPIREITKGILESYGYNVLTAQDGTEGVALYTTSQDIIKIVITDMMMPFMDGAVVIRTLQKIDPTVKIIATSGLAETDNITELRSENVKAFLRKPFQADQLLKVIGSVLSDQISDDT